MQASESQEGRKAGDLSWDHKSMGAMRLHELREHRQVEKGRHPKTGEGAGPAKVTEMGIVSKLEENQERVVCQWLNEKVLQGVMAGQVPERTEK